MQTIKNDISVLRKNLLANSFEKAVEKRELIASRIATFIEVDGDTWEYKLYGGKASTVETGADVKDAEMYNSEFAVSAGKAFKHPVELTDRIYVDATYDSINEYFHTPSVAGGERTESDRNLAVDFDRTVINKGYDAATTLAGAADVTDQASAEALVEKIEDEVVGLNGTSASDIVVVMNTAAKKHFRDILDARQTVVGDKSLISGEITTIRGISFIFTRKNDITLNMANGELEDDAAKLVIDDGKALIVVDKKLDVAKKAMEVFEGTPAASAAGKINIQKSFVFAIYFVVSLLPWNKRFVLKNA